MYLFRSNFACKLDSTTTFLFAVWSVLCLHALESLCITHLKAMLRYPSCSVAVISTAVTAITAIAMPDVSCVNTKDTDIVVSFCLNIVAFILLSVPSRYHCPYHYLCLFPVALIIICCSLYGRSRCGLSSCCFD